MIACIFQDMAVHRVCVYVSVGASMCIYIYTYIWVCVYMGIGGSDHSKSKKAKGSSVVSSSLLIVT